MRNFKVREGLEAKTACIISRFYGRLNLEVLENLALVFRSRFKQLRLCLTTSIHKGKVCIIYLTVISLNNVNVGGVEFTKVRCIVRICAEGFPCTFQNYLFTTAIDTGDRLSCLLCFLISVDKLLGDSADFSSCGFHITDTTGNLIASLLHHLTEGDDILRVKYHVRQCLLNSIESTREKQSLRTERGHIYGVLIFAVRLQHRCMLIKIRFIIESRPVICNQPCDTVDIIDVLICGLQINTESRGYLLGRFLSLGHILGFRPSSFGKHRGDGLSLDINIGNIALIILISLHKRLDIQVLKSFKHCLIEVSDIVCLFCFRSSFLIYSQNGLEFVEDSLDRISKLLPSITVLLFQFRKLHIGILVSKHLGHSIANKFFIGSIQELRLTRNSLPVSLVTCNQLFLLLLNEAIDVNTLLPIILHEEVSNNLEVFGIMFTNIMPNLMRQRVEHDTFALVACVDINVNLIAVLVVSVGCKSLLAVYDGISLAIFDDRLIDMNFK